MTADCSSRGRESDPGPVPYFHREGSNSRPLDLQSDSLPFADPGIVSLILARSYTFVMIDHEIISMFNLSSLPLIQERLLSVTSKNMCTKLAKEKSMVR